MINSQVPTTINISTGVYFHKLGHIKCDPFYIPSITRRSSLLIRYRTFRNQMRYEKEKDLPAKLEIISLKGFCEHPVVNSVTGLIGFDKKGRLAILWKYLFLSATYWAFCCGAFPCHNLAFVQTDKIVPLSCKMKTVVDVQFGNHLFTIYFIEIQFALVRKDVGIFMPLLTNEQNSKETFGCLILLLKMKCMEFLANGARLLCAE